MRNRGKLTANRLAGGGERERRGRIRVDTVGYIKAVVWQREKMGETGDGALAA